MGAAVAKIHSVFTNNAAIEKLNQHLPDEVTTAAVAKIHSVFTNNAAIEKLNQHLPDEVTTSKIAENLAKNSAAAAVQEGLKFVPGGPIVYKIVNRSLGDDKKSKEHKKDVQELKDKVGRMEKELSDCRKSLEQTKIRKSKL